MIDLKERFLYLFVIKYYLSLLIKFIVRVCLALNSYLNLKFNIRNFKICLALNRFKIAVKLVNFPF